MPQTSVQMNPARGLEGQLDEAAPHFRESMVVDETNGVPFGRAVTLESGTDRTVSLPNVTGEASAAYGVAGRNPTYPSNDKVIGDGDGVTVVRFGIVTVVPEDAVSKGDAPFIRFDSGAGGSALGSFRSDADTATAAENTNMEFLDDGVAGQPVRLWIKGA